MHLETDSHFKLVKFFPPGFCIINIRDLFVLSLLYKIAKQLVHLTFLCRNYISRWDFCDSCNCDLQTTQME